MKNSSSIASASNAGARLPALVALCSLVFGFAALVCAPRVAKAEKKVVVLDFAGKGVTKIQKAVVAIIKKEHTVIPQRRYTRTAKKLKAKSPSNENVARVLGELEADGAVIGTVKKKRGRVYQVRIRLRAATDGDFVNDFTVLTKGKKLTPKAKKVVRRKLLAAIEELPAAEEEVEEEPIEEPAELEDQPVVAEASEEGDEEVELEKKKTGDAELTDAEKADLLVRGSAFDVAAGLSFIGRSLSFDVREGLPGEDAPHGYDGTPVGGAYVTAEVYPLAMNPKRKGFLRNFGLTAMVDKVLKIESRLSYRDGTNLAEIVLPSSQLRWAVGLVYRHNFGKKPTSPSVKVGVRYGGFSFTIDRTKADAASVPVDTPDMEYTLIEPALGIRLPLGAKLALIGEFRYLAITGVGDMQLDTQYGGASVSGLEGDVGVEIAVTKQIYARAGGRLTMIGFEFEPGAELTSNRDGDPSTQDVLGADDQYLGGYLTAAYRF